MNCKSKYRTYNLALALAAGILTTSQVGCQVATSSMFSALSRPIPLGDPSSTSETDTDLPASDHFADIQDPGQSQQDVQFGDVARDASVEPVVDSLPFEPDPVSYKFVNPVTQPGLVSPGNIAQVSWEAPIDARNQPPSVPDKPLLKNIADTGRVAAEPAMRNLDERFDNQPQSLGWKDSFAKARKLEHQDDLQVAATIYETLVGQGFKQPEIFHRLGSWEK